jgi:predicted DNA-binding transcriptional regulator AlpA
MRNAKTETALERRLVTYHELPALGINFSITHLRRMWNDGRFPPPVYTSARRFAWPIDDLDNWIATATTKPPRRPVKR